MPTLDDRISAITLPPRRWRPRWWAVIGLLLGLVPCIGCLGVLDREMDWTGAVFGPGQEQTARKWYDRLSQVSDPEEATRLYGSQIQVHYFSNGEWIMGVSF